jgi:TPR repeat protein
VEWFYKAAHSGYSEACFNIALRHEYGSGLPQDLIQAYLWYSASEGANKDDFAAKQRERLASKMTPEELAEGERLAREWFEKHSK